ncbi:plasminogen-binding N-terminal domain-containing protein [Helicobacter ailurogastricus]|uniref:Plasminogen-binding protein PgbA N-terminal domain-containing protein n=1 Tax=Helicobacter ailurogastricus TaxID=1578720 RepID=A0A0K2X5V9_9HELI|nr:plasminogen-binding N-terminal domain-containing protein [Helicobacter ailurogastricus]CRF41421.1 FIG00710332: hypothetical protein [Helicobacter ailurogastricus]CRF43195.1 FIG00710332: hypothetical protein [Helicobacter ailurogastricus]CRF43500.1 FIG00710332: hypothetical protein [Helicobacter ailurogastricus]
MLKWFLAILGLCGLLHAKDWSAPLKINIDGVDTARKVVRFQAYDLKVGESGYVLAKLTDYDVIAASLEVLSIENGVAYAKYAPYKVMKQKHLPTPRMVPKKGNLAIFREFNNQAFLIAPDLHTYEQVKDDYPDATFINSDLLVAFLNGFDPTAKTLRRACDIYSVGLVYLVSTNRLNILDCQSFAILETQPLDTTKVGRTFSPFFSRVEGVDRGTFGKLVAGGKARHYFTYYDNLLRKESEKKLAGEVKAEDKRELKKDIKHAKSQKQKQALEKEYNEEINEEKQLIAPKLSKEQKAEEQALDKATSKERAKEAKEAKKRRKKELAKERLEEKAERKAKKAEKKREKAEEKRIRQEEKQ